ncbi:MAG: cadmium-translocating P-type ATPase [Oscillospiraceae bacterium]|nr:cadmium-translocating P-type ATPase [Oscillospiraceae bacterium]
MAKHLAQKSKHELKRERRPREESLPESTESDASAEERTAPPRRRAFKASALLGRFRYLPLVLSAILLLGIPLLPLEGWQRTACYILPLLIVGADLVWIAVRRVRQGEYFCAECVALLAAVLLLASAHGAEAVLLLILLRAAKLLEQFLNGKNDRDLQDVYSMKPEHASLVTEGGIRQIRPEEAKVGDILFVAAGEWIPLDGVITEGITTIDTASISGQRSPWAVNEGYRVYSGCVNLTSDVKIRVTREYEQSTVNSILKVLLAAPDFPSEQKNTLGRAMIFYTLGVAVLALLLGLIVPIFRGQWAQQLARAAILLISICFAAESFALPLAYRKGIALAAKGGIFVKGEDCLEALAKADTVVFDKTGTITEGRYSVTQVVPEVLGEHELLTVAAMAESFSRHPIAAAIREAAGKLDSRLLKVIKIREIPGRGVSAFIGDRQVYVGNAALLEEHGIKCALPKKPGTAVHVAVGEQYCGHILVADKVRRRAFDALEGLRVNGIEKLVLLTGDVLSAARPIASRLNFDMLRAELRPEDKANAVEYLMDNKGETATIAFVGDGENDRQIMSRADAAIAMGALGSEAALAAADVLIMDKDITKVPRIVGLSKGIFRVVRENLLAGAAVSLLLILLGAFGVISPLAAELIMFVLWAAVLLNTLRIQ